MRTVLSPLSSERSFVSTRPERRWIGILAVASVLCLFVHAKGQDATKANSAKSTAEAKEYRQGVVVAVSAPGAEAGLEMLKKGGTAVDAAIATAFAMAVTHPAAGNIGGGGFMMVHTPGGEPVCIDYREIAPAAAHPDFLRGVSKYSHRVVGVPGTVRGMAMAHKKFAKLDWKVLLGPAIQLAEQGFELDAHHAKSLNDVVASVRKTDSPGRTEFLRVFARSDAKPWKPGDRLIQPDLAKTMRLIAEGGPEAFYAGPVADQLVAEMKRGGGVITKSDLAGYQAQLRKPVRGEYRGHVIYGPPPPSSGGICLVEMLQILEHFDLAKWGRNDPKTIHVMAEAMRRAYADRAQSLGDPSFTAIPAKLVEKSYARTAATTIRLTEATKSEAVAPRIKLQAESDHTTHFSVIDCSGMAVSNTYTLENSYGSRIVVPGAGFLLNNEMLDFNQRPGVTTTKGDIGTDANLVRPKARMLSSQTPILVVKDGKLLLVTGSPGGRTIINTVLNVVVNVIDFGMPLQKAVDTPRFHHQWFPDEVRLEKSLTGARDESLAEALRKIGHRVEWTTGRQGDAHSIWIDPKTGGFRGAADRRLSGHVAGY